MLGGRRLVLTPPLKTAGIRSVPGPTCSEVGRCKIAISTTSCRLDRSACEVLRPDRETLWGSDSSVVPAHQNGAAGL